jgi:rSAM/selenodomain-associated transferase 1
VRADRSVVGVMARAPSAAGKTRLAPHLPPERLTSLRAALLADTLDLVARARERPGSNLDAVVFFTPSDAHVEIAAMAGEGVPLVAQSEGDLGQRMRSALEHLIDERGYGAAMLVGSDVPLLSIHCLEAARDTLRREGGLVLGPADDGGYYLVGMTRVEAGLFEQIAWGSASVLTDTLRAAERLAIEARLVPSAGDIDTIEDLRRLEHDLASAAPDVARHVRSWFRDRSGTSCPPSGGL